MEPKEMTDKVRLQPAGQSFSLACSGIKGARKLTALSDTICQEGEGGRGVILEPSLLHYRRAFHSQKVPTHLWSYRLFQDLHSLSGVPEAFSMEGSLLMWPERSDLCNRAGSS